MTRHRLSRRTATITRFSPEGRLPETDSAMLSGGLLMISFTIYDIVSEIVVSGPGL